MKNNERVDFIPKGINCYDKDGMCPHFETKESKQGLIIKAFCHYKGFSDFKLNDKFKICNLNIN